MLFSLLLAYGTRFLPATKAIPKEMLPIIDKPLIEYAVEEAVLAGITEIIFITSHTKRSIEDHFNQNYELEKKLVQLGNNDALKKINRDIFQEVTFTYVKQSNQKGLGDAVLQARHLIEEEPFAVVLADDLCDCEDEGVLSQMIDVYNQYNCSIIALQEVPISETDKYGIVKGVQISDSKNIFQITNMVEKPATIDALAIWL